MSDTYFVLIPTDPRFVPPEEAQQVALRLVQESVPRFDAATIEVSEHPEFVPAIECYEKGTCPFCGTELDKWFWDAVSRAYEASAFDDLETDLPCCGRRHPLNDLRFVGAQGFARFRLCVLNPDLSDKPRVIVEDIPEGLVERVGEILGCPVRLVRMCI